MFLRFVGCIESAEVAETEARDSGIPPVYLSDVGLVTLVRRQELNLHLPH